MYYRACVRAVLEGMHKERHHALDDCPQKLRNSAPRGGLEDATEAHAPLTQASVMYYVGAAAQAEAGHAWHDDNAQHGAGNASKGGEQGQAPCAADLLPPQHAGPREGSTC